jgi:hypothetical protein
VILMTALSSAPQYSADAIQKASDPLGSPLPYVRSEQPNSVQSVILVRSVRFANGATQVARVTAGACGGISTERQITIRNAPHLMGGDLLIVILLNGDRPNELAHWGLRKTSATEKREYHRCVH